MLSQRYTAEFKAEAVKQITEKGYRVAEVAERLGVSGHSLYAWVKAAPSGGREPAAVNELETMRQENMRLKAALKRVEEERDILKKAAKYFAGVSA
jgi:transposase